MYAQSSPRQKSILVVLGVMHHLGRQRRTRESALSAELEYGRVVAVHCRCEEELSPLDLGLERSRTLAAACEPRNVVATPDTLDNSKLGTLEELPEELEGRSGDNLGLRMPAHTGVGKKVVAGEIGYLNLGMTAERTEVV
jgi:hypothetical protein